MAIPKMGRTVVLAKKEVTVYMKIVSQVLTYQMLHSVETANS